MIGRYNQTFLCLFLTVTLVLQPSECKQDAIGRMSFLYHLYAGGYRQLPKFGYQG